MKRVIPLSVIRGNDASTQMTLWRTCFVCACVVVLKGMGQGVQVRWLQRQTMVSVVLALLMMQKLEVIV